MKLTTMAKVTIDGVLQEETGPDIAFDLIESRVDAKGVTIQTYRPAGRPQYAVA